MDYDPFDLFHRPPLYALLHPAQPILLLWLFTGSVNAVTGIVIVFTRPVIAFSRKFMRPSSPWSRSQAM